jgi:hypothetical protein
VHPTPTGSRANWRPRIAMITPSWATTTTILFAFFPATQVLLAHNAPIGTKTSAELKSPRQTFPTRRSSD